MRSRSLTGILRLRLDLRLRRRGGGSGRLLLGLLGRQGVDLDFSLNRNLNFSLDFSLNRNLKLGRRLGTRTSTVTTMVPLLSHRSRQNSLPKRLKSQSQRWPHSSDRGRAGNECLLRGVLWIWVLCIERRKVGFIGLVSATRSYI
jgi:hypothetical protein